MFSSERAQAAAALQAAAPLLACRSAGERHQVFLKLLCKELSGDVRAYIVSGAQRSGYTFSAVAGYEADLLALAPQYGPWNEGDPDVKGAKARTATIRGGGAEAFAANSDDILGQLAALELLGAKSIIAAPLGRGAHRSGRRWRSWLEIKPWCCSATAARVLAPTN